MPSRPREGRRRACNRDGPTAASPAAERALRGGARGAERPDAGRGDGTSVRPSAHFHGQGFHAMLSTGFHGKLSAGSTAS